VTLAETLKLLLLVSIILNVLALALRARTADATYLFREWRFGLRAFGVMFVVAPALAILMAYTFDLKPEVKVALVALSLSPVPPILPGKQLRAGASGAYITGLLVGASLLSLVVTPLGLELVGIIFRVEIGISPMAVAKVIAIGIAAPLVAGLVGQWILGARAERVSGVLAKISSIMLVLCVLVLLVALAPHMWSVIGDGTLLALAAMILAGYVAGHLLAGDIADDRVALSLAAAARHPGVAVTIASVNFPGNKLITAAIVLYVLLNALLSIPYLRWQRSKHGAVS
jgi:BASS family bile acid:Na+ symporter